MKLLKMFLVFICMVMLIIACGSGSDDNGGDNGGTGDVSGGGATGNPLAVLEGTWLGTLIDPTGTPHRIVVTIDANGNLTDHIVDGVPTGDTATLAMISNQIFSFVDSNGIKGILAVDANILHGGFVDESAHKGVLEKGANVIPVYLVTDINGQWSGYGCQLNTNMEIVISLTSDASVNNLVYTVDDNLNTDINGNFDTWIPGYGVWQGPYNLNVLGESGEFIALLSPDKSFATTYSINTAVGGFSFPADYRFRFLSRQ